MSLLLTCAEHDVVNQCGAKVGRKIDALGYAAEEDLCGGSL
jgi:hypothetical protein